MPLPCLGAPALLPLGMLVVILSGLPLEKGKLESLFMTAHHLLAEAGARCPYLEAMQGSWGMQPILEGYKHHPRGLRKERSIGLKELCSQSLPLNSVPTRPHSSFIVVPS